MRLDGFGLFVNDMPAMIRFYRDVLGFEITEEENTDNVYLVKDGMLFLLYGRSDFENMTSRKYQYAQGLNGHCEIALYVDTFDEVDAVFNMVVEKGAEAVLPPTTEPWGQRTCYIADPEGNLIEIGSFNRPYKMNRHDKNGDNPVMDAIMARRSIRRFTAEPVTHEAVELLLKAAMAAPSACNLQPWAFIVVDEPQLLQGLRATAEQGDYNAPLAIVVCGINKHIPWGGDGWMQDCGGAAQNIMLECVELGLASVCIGGFDETALKSLLKVPDDVYIL